MLLLTIDNEKVEQELKKVTPGYAVSASYLEPEPAGYVEIPSTDAHGTANALPPDVEAARERLMALRQRAIDSGMRTLSFDGLQVKIDEIRGR